MTQNNGASGKSFTFVSEQSKGSSASENSQITETKFLENTPFAIVRFDEKYFVGCGKYRLTGLMDTEEEAEEYARAITWNNITAVIGIIVEHEINTALERKTMNTGHRLISENEEEK